MKCKIDNYGVPYFDNALNNKNKKMAKKNKTSLTLSLQTVLKYHKSPIVFTDGDGKKREGFIKSISINRDRPLEVEVYPKAYYHLSLDECKLRLRTIESLTEDEKYELSFYASSNDIINDPSLGLASGDLEYIDQLIEWGIDVYRLIKLGIAEEVR